MRGRNEIEISPMSYDKLILEVLLDIRSLLSARLPAEEPVVETGPLYASGSGDAGYVSDKPPRPEATKKRKRKQIKKNAPTLVCV